MRVLIVEDEPPIAEYIEESVRSILGSALRSLRTALSLEDASRYLEENVIDLCLLDLNLSGEDGFTLLKEAVSRPFLTIVISAHTDRALQAFDYGVIDFLPKPFALDRLRRSLERLLCRNPQPGRARYLVSRKRNQNVLLSVEDILFLKAARYLVEAHRKDGRVDLLEKSLDGLEWILPENFARIHRSYIANLDQVAAYEHAGANVYRVRMKGGVLLPLSRSRYPLLNKIFHK